jgi:outer membrane protein assembly factor BamB
MKPDAGPAVLPASRLSGRLLALVLSAACVTFAATTTTWEMSGYQDFLRGRMSGLSLTHDGKLVIGPKIETLFTSDQPEIWTVAKAPAGSPNAGSLYLGTGNGGRLYRVNAGKATLVWTADQPEIFAVTVDSKGVVYAGTSPDGKVYRIENGKASEYFDPHARYIWALQFASDGALFVATGDQGKIFRVTGAGRGSVYYETGQSHVTCLAIDAQGRLLAGSEPNGILYRITAENKAFVLYDANLPEIRAIVPAPDGTIYASALGGSIARRTGSSPNATSGTEPLVGPTISVTVTDAQAGIAPTPKPEPAKTTAVVQPAVVAPVTETAGVERSAIYKIHPDNTVETLWSSKEENAYDLMLAGNDLMFVTDSQARVYRLGQDRKSTLVAQANEGEATRLLESPEGPIVATGNLGKLLRLSDTTGATGWYESPVHDAGTVARWGRLSCRGETLVNPSGCGVKTRTGNSARPDATWSDWSGVNPQESITSPNARYIQWRAEFNGGPTSLDSVTIAFLPQNTPPIVRSINVTALPAAAKASSTSVAYSVTVTDTGEPPIGTPSQTLGRAPNGQVQISWQAEDPDGDRLIYNLYFRGDGEREWKLLKANMSENSYLLDGDVFADGRYVFKVTASDAPSNPANLAREAELVSAPVLVDNTPPVVTASAPRRNGTVVDIDVDAQDRASALRRCEYSIDAGPWWPIEAADGLTDSERERFNIHVANLAAGEHLIVIRVYDTAGNAGLAKVIVR